MTRWTPHTPPPRLSPAQVPALRCVVYLRIASQVSLHGAIDAVACFWVEEVQRPRVDDRRDSVALCHARASAEPADDDRLVLLNADLRRLASDVFGQLAHLVRLGVRRLDRKVRH